jgi:uncharacterized membrane protein
MDTLFFHPKVVHIPIALGMLMPLIAAALAVAWWRGWLPSRSWALAVALQAVLVGSGIVALQTGESEEERVERVVAERTIKGHEEAAEVFVGVSGGILGIMLLALIAGRRKAGLPIAAAATLGTLVVLALGYRTGQAGGELVYRHNAASVYAGIGGPASADANRGYEHDDDDDDDDD